MNDRSKERRLCRSANSERAPVISPEVRCAFCSRSISQEDISWSSGRTIAANEARSCDDSVPIDLEPVVGGIDRAQADRDDPDIPSDCDLLASGTAIAIAILPHPLALDSERRPHQSRRRRCYRGRPGPAARCGVGVPAARESSDASVISLLLFRFMTRKPSTSSEPPSIVTEPVTCIIEYCSALGAFFQLDAIPVEINAIGAIIPKEPFEKVRSVFALAARQAGLSRAAPFSALPIRYDE